MKLSSLSYEDYISPTIRVIIKNKIEVILNKIYPKKVSLKSILLSEGLPFNNNYYFQKNLIDINTPLIDIISNNINNITSLEIIVESENILDTINNNGNINYYQNNFYKILCPYEKPFRILCFRPKENSVSIIKYTKENLNFFGLDNFSISKSSYCNTYNDLFLSTGYHNIFLKINHIKLNIEKLDNIPWEKKYHSMIYIPRKYIYFIGGNNKATFYYDFINNNFSMWAKMKFQHKYPSLVFVNNTTIYAFGQQKQISDNNFIEKSNIKMNPKWEVLNVKLSEPFCLKKFGGAFSDDEKIIFVGGKKEKNEKIFYFDLKTNEISKTSQINTGMKIGECNFYKINEFSSVLIPQESKGDIKLILFNQRTKKFRKIRYERDYDMTSEKHLLEPDEEFLSENLNLNTEINLKKIGYKYEKDELTKEPEQEDLEIIMPNLSEIKKLLLGDKNILNKNVEAMIFNRNRIKNKKLDKIDGDESENEYDYNYNDFNLDNDNISENELNENNFDITNDKKLIYLRDIFNQDIAQEITPLKVKNPIIESDNYDYIQNKIPDIPTKNDIDILFDNNNNTLQFNLTGKKRDIQINDRNKYKNPEIKKNINNIIDLNNIKNKNVQENNRLKNLNRNNNNEKQIELKSDNMPIISEKSD